MVPMPTPAPPMPMHAIPAPMYLAATGSITELLFCLVGERPSVPRMKRIVQIDAGENGEHVGLQEGNQELKRRQRDDQAERQGRAKPANSAQPAEHGGEAGEHG